MKIKHLPYAFDGKLVGVFGVPGGTRTHIGGLGGYCVIPLRYGNLWRFCFELFIKIQPLQATF